MKPYLFFAITVLLAVGGSHLLAGEEVDPRMDAMIRRAEKPDAPDLTGASAWINIEKPLTLAQLKGKVVLLDFWTFG